MYGKEKEDGESLWVCEHTRERLTGNIEGSAGDPGLIQFYNKLPKKSPQEGTLRLFLRVQGKSTLFARGERLIAPCVLSFFPRLW